MIDLTAKEREIVLLVMQGEKQKDIAKKVGVDLSTIHRTLKREHVQKAISRWTEIVFSEVIEKITSTYDSCLDRINKEIDSMPISNVISYMNHSKQVIQKFYIESAQKLFKEISQSNDTIETIEVTYSDYGYQVDQKVKDALKKFGIPEEKYKNSFFG